MADTYIFGSTLSTAMPAVTRRPLRTLDHLSPSVLTTAIVLDALLLGVVLGSFLF
jgi:hypothetical protein